MALNEEHNVYRLININDVCLGECLDELMDFDDSESNEECEDIVDLLPNDPFEMEFNSGLPDDQIPMNFNISLPKDPFGVGVDIEATTGRVEDFDRKAYGFETEEDNSNGDSKSFAGLNFVWTGSMNYDQEDEMIDGSYNDLTCFGCEKYETAENVKDNRSADGDTAAEKIGFVLRHLDLGVKCLLSVEQVCKSLRDAVRSDPYLWTKIHIESSLSLKITNDDLVRLTDRAKGKLHSLSLEKCLKITNDGLKQVLERNLELTKLSVAGSIKLRVEGILQNIRVFNSVALPGIKCLRIGEPIGLTNEHLKEFKLLLGSDEDAEPNNYKPRYYRNGEIYLSLDDERAIDVETCPRCQKLGQVYDCPTENCQANTHSGTTCRACSLCIARCMLCGCCLDDRDYEETFFLDSYCFDCLEEHLDDPTYFQMSSYHFFLYR